MAQLRVLSVLVVIFAGCIENISAKSLTVYPIADSYVTRAQPNWNVHTGMLAVQRFDKSQYESFLRFDISSVVASKSKVLGAKLRLHPLYVGDSGITNNVAVVPDNTWQQNSITWADKPDSNLVLGSFEPTTGKPVEVDVTYNTQQAETGEQKVSFRIYSPTEISAKSTVQYGSSRRVMKRPELELEVLAPTDGAQSVATGEGLTSAMSGASSKVTIQAKDADGDVQAAGGAEFKAALICTDVPSYTRSLISNATVLDELDGTYTVTYTPTGAGACSLSITLDGVDITDSPFAVEVVPGPVSAKHSSASGVGIVEAISSTTSQFTITARDGFGNPRGLAAADPIFTAIVDNPSTGVLVDAVVTEGPDNTYVVEYQVEKSGPYNITVKLGTNNIMGSPFQAIVLPGRTEAITTVAMGDGLKESITGTPASFMIQARDAAGNDRSVCGDSFLVSLIGPGATRVHGLVEAANNGSYIVEYTSTVSGPYTIHVTLGGAEISNSPFFMQAKPAETKASHSVASGEHLTFATAGELTKFDILAKDTYGNSENEGGEDFVAQLTGPATISANVSDLGDGQYKVEYTPVKAGQYELSIKLGTKDIFGGPYTTVVQPGPAIASGTTVDCIGQADCGATYGVAGQVTSFHIVCSDEQGNPRSSGGDDFQVEVSSAGPRGPVINTTVVDLLDGRYLVTFRVLQSGAYNVAVALNNQYINGAPFDLNVVAGAVSAARSTATMMESAGRSAYFTNLVDLGVTAAGDTGTLTVQAKDAYGNDLTQGGAEFMVTLTHPGVPNVDATVTDNNNGTYSAQFVCDVAGEWTVHARSDDMDIDGSPFNLMMSSSVANPTTTVAVGKSVKLGICGISNRFIVIGKDAFGNDKGLGGDTISASLVHQINVTETAEATWQDNTDGTYSVQYNISLAGPYTMTVNINGEALGGSPYTVEAYPGPTHTESSTAHGQATVDFVAGEEAVVDLRAKDKHSNQRTMGGDRFTAHLMPVSFASNETVPAVVDDLGDGHYNVRWNATIAGRYDLVIRQNGDDIKDGPLSIECLPAATMSANSVIVGAGVTESTAGVTQTAYIRSRDRFDNFRTTGGDVWTVKMIGSDGGDDIENLIEDLGDGSYNFTYRSDSAGKYAVTLTGADGIDSVTSPYNLVVSPNELSGPKCIASGAGLTSATAGLKACVIIRAKDAYSNDREQGELGGNPFEISGTGPEAIFGNATHNADAAGTYTACYTITKSGLYELAITVNGAHITGSPFQNVKGLPAAVNTEHSTASGAGLSTGEAAISGNFEIQARDEFDNAKTKGGDEMGFTAKMTGPQGRVVKASVIAQLNGKFTVTYLTDVAGAYKTWVQRSEVNIKDGPFDTVILPGPTHAMSCPTTMPAGEVTPELVSGVPGEFVITAMDEFGNTQTDGGDDFQVNITGPLSKAGPPKIEASLTDDNNGNYTVSYSLTEMGEYSIGVGLRGGAGVQGSPYALYVVPGPTSASHCEAFGAGWTEAYAGMQNRFGILEKDASSNVKNSGGTRFEVILTGPKDEVINASVKETVDGVYTVTYKPSHVGQYTVNVKIDGQIPILDGANHLLDVKGVSANMKRCPRNCSDHGFCSVQTGRCSCDTNYDGFDCSKQIVQDKECPNNCWGKGICNPVSGKCQCETPWGGEDCSTRLTLGAGATCPNDCSGHGNCNSTLGRCVCFADWDGDDCSRGGVHDLIYVGSDRVFNFEPSSGHYTVLSFERSGVVGTCAGLMQPPIAQGVWNKRNVQFVYMAEGDLMEYEPITGQFTVIQCTNAYTAGQPMPCNGKKVSGIWCGMKGEEVRVIYVGGNRALFYDGSNGNYAVHRYDRQAGLDADPFSCSTVAEGQWNQTTHHVFSYMQDDLLLDYVPTSGKYSFWLYDRQAVNDENPLKGPVTAGSFLVDGHQFMSAGDGAMISYEPLKGDYTTWKCDMSGFRYGLPLPCNKASSGNIFAGPVCNDGGKCDIDTRESCVTDPACGWCAELNACAAGAEDGPESGSCLSWDYGTFEVAYALTYLQEGELLDYNPATGKYKMWNVPSVEDHSGACDSIQWPPVAYGQLSIINHNLVYVGKDQILDYNPNTGGYRIGRMDRAKARAETHLIVDTLNQGAWPDIEGKHQVLFVGQDTLLDFESATGTYVFWAFNYNVTEQSHPLEDKPRASGSWANLIGHEITYLDKDLILTIHPVTGKWYMFEMDRSVEKLDPFGEPRATGVLMARHKQFLYLGHNNLMQFNPSNSQYKMFACSRTSSSIDAEKAPNSGFGSVIFKDSPFQCSLTSEGGLPDGPVCNTTSPQECLSNKKCGWCHSTGVCMQGSSAGPCAPGKCPAFEYAADSPCEGVGECSACVSHHACGFCDDQGDTRGCKIGTSGGPSFGECGQWLHETCAVADCTSITSCGLCAANNNCGWCADGEGSCFDGSEEKPMHEACDNWLFSKPSCDAPQPAQPKFFAQ